ncbi:cell wall-binding repeat-containing protein [Peptacetobacter sp.]|uniref:cell wall-binding repeat-containing protein n=1 Tax=Peptacetobacter sp. TaxID=2991975 RepID=UPI002617D155|nr:cell wall-binding repeat-containing protein [Peptacetobacter sp.]
MKKVISTIITSVLILSTTISSSLALSQVEIKGKDRYETSALISDKQNYTTAILVNSTNSIADGLSASALSGASNAPIFLIKQNQIPTSIELRLECANKIYIIGSENAISKNIENSLKKSGFYVNRLGGKNRYETSINVAKEVKKVKGGASETFIVNGVKGEADAMSVSSVAARDSAPVILTNGEKIHPEAEKIVKSIPNRYAIGLDGVMSEKLVKSLKATRVGGKNRYETNKNIIQKFYRNVSSYYLSKSNQFVDALSASPITKYSPIVLVSKNSDKSVLKGATKITALGGIDKETIDNCIKAAK